MNRRDLELLSSYLDGQLKPADAFRLEARLTTEPDLASALNDLRAARTLLRKLPQRRAPRNFTLTRKMVGQNPPLPRAYPFFRFATALATLLFIFSFGLNSVGTLARQNIGIGGAGGNPAEAQPYNAATQLPAAEAPSLAQVTAIPTSIAPMVPLPTQTAPVDATNQALTLEAQASKSAQDSYAGGQQPPQSLEAPTSVQLVPLNWQIGLGVFALLFGVLTFLMRRFAMSHWRK